MIWSVTAAHPTHFLALVHICFVQTYELALAGVGGPARLELSTFLKLWQVCIMISHKHVIDLRIPFGIDESLDLLITLVTFERAATFWIHAALRKPVF